MQAMQLQGHRLQLYGVFSTVLVSAVVASAFHKHSNFYSATVHLSRSSASVMVLANYGGFLALLFGRLVQQIFFGRLTNQEIERLYDRTWFFLTESLLAFTIFRDEFNAPFMMMFGALLFLKCFHWLIGDRIDWMDQQPYPGPNWVFHIRTNVLFAILWAVDLLMLDFALESIFNYGVSGVVLFVSEYAILLATLLNSMMKYGIMAYDLRRAQRNGGEDAPVWENKSMYMFYIELLTDFLKLSTYLAFFTVVMTFFGLPLNIIRDVYMTGVSFYTRFRDLLRYRAATKDMETKYPDATEAELTAMSDRTCIICREEMSLTPARSIAQAAAAEQHERLQNGGIRLDRAGLPQPGQTMGAIRDPPKKLACGHVFHFQCLRSWLERQQSCPTCRRSVLEEADTPANAAAPGANGAGGNQNQNRQGAANPPPPAPGAIPQLPAQPAPTPGPAQNQNQAQNRAANVNGNPAGARTGRAQAGPSNEAQRNRSAATAPRAFQGFSVGGEWHSWAVPTTDAPTPTPTTSIPGASSSSANGATQGASAGPTSTEGLATPRVITGTLSPTGSNDEASSTGSTTPTRPQDAAATSSAAPAASSSEPTPASDNDFPEEALSPREAAAAAALKRFGGGGSSSKSPATEPPSAPKMEAPLPAPVAAATIPEASTSSTYTPAPEASTSTSTFTPAPVASTSSNKSISLPTLIPLFDPSSVANRPFINLDGLMSFDGSISGTATPGGGLISPGRGRTYSTSSLSAFAQANATGGFPWSANGGGQARTPAGTPLGMRSRVGSVSSLASLLPSGAGNPAPPALGLSAASARERSQSQTMPQLSRAPSAYFTDSPTAPLHVPAALTDDTQLRRIDAWTREAIDERLRVLEDVQQSLWRAAEELQRVRSLMPSSSSSTPLMSAAEREQEEWVRVQAAHDSKMRDERRKGKARAVFDVQEEPEPLDESSGSRTSFEES